MNKCPDFLQQRAGVDNTQRVLNKQNKIMDDLKELYGDFNDEMIITYLLLENIWLEQKLEEDK